jgi:hypothetical protein
MAPSTADRLELVHGVGSSLPNVAGILGKEARDGDGAAIGGGAVTFATWGGGCCCCSGCLRFSCLRRGKFHVQDADRPLDSQAWQISM